jgi:hypothetical protein
VTKIARAENLPGEILFYGAQIFDEQTRKEIFVDAPTSH